MEYRNDLEAARMRIETLEAKLSEKEAALRARDAELAEKGKELSRLGPKGSSSRANQIALHVFFSVLALGLGVMLGLLIGPRPDPKPAVETGPSVETIGTVTRGKTGIKDEPPQERAPRTEATGSARDDETPSLGQEVDDMQGTMRRQLRACHAKEKEKHPDASGFVNVVFDIEPKGTVSRVALTGMIQSSDPWWSKDFEACVIAAYKKLEFHPFTGEKTAARHSFMLSKTDLGF